MSHGQGIPFPHSHLLVFQRTIGEFLYFAKCDVGSQGKSCDSEIDLSLVFRAPLSKAGLLG